MNIEAMKNFKVDKSTWGSGPWQDEPDRIDFRHAGFPCLMLRNPTSGNWCGYVGVPTTHPDHSRSYDDIDVDVHGGLTYAELCDGERICHVPEPGESDDVFWFGFDCGHCFDFSPAYYARYPHFEKIEGEVYRDVDYVRAQVESLANQLAARR